ncbi:MAG: relaxase/mobilization nuclease domain-containing protein [Alphaproteobacteria bacterium]|nr:relaxase/mobilization nuclease domain-containing protein [Alphaproteobacteria bacterium]
MEAQQALNTTVKEDKQYHLMVSFGKEKPPLDALKDIELECAKALGFEDHPRVVGTHVNTDNFHMHIAYSRIHPVTLNGHDPNWDYPALQKVCRAMEKKYGLKVDLGRNDGQEVDLKPQKARDMEAQTWEQSFFSYVQERKEPLLKARAKAKTWQDLHQAFAKYDLALKKRGNGLVISSRATNQHSKKHSMKASDLDRSFSKAALEKEFGPYRGPEKAQERTRPVSRYERRPITKHPLQGRLWRLYIGQRQKPPSLTAKVFKTWRNFLMLSVDDPLAMSIIIFHNEMMKMAFAAKKPQRAPSIPPDRGIQ